MAMGDKYDPKYRLRHRVTSARRLLKYDHVPPMVDDPPDVAGMSWEDRCRAVYRHMILIKRGMVPPSRQRGLWFYAA